MTENNGGNATSQDEITGKLKDLGFESLEKLLADREAVKAERDNFKTQHENLEKLMKRQGTELGELRKIAEQLKTNGTKKEEAHVEPVKTDNPPEESVEKIEASLTEQQKQAVDMAYSKLSEEDKMLVAEDPKYRKQLLLEARKAIRVPPKSLFGKPDAVTQPTDDLENKIRKLFDTNKQMSRYTPSGPSGGATTVGAVVNEKPEVNTRGGVLAAAKAMRGAA